MIITPLNRDLVNRKHYEDYISYISNAVHELLRLSTKFYKGHVANFYMK